MAKLIMVIEKDEMISIMKETSKIPGLPPSRLFRFVVRIKILMYRLFGRSVKVTVKESGSEVID